MSERESEHVLAWCSAVSHLSSLPDRAAIRTEIVRFIIVNVSVILIRKADLNLFVNVSTPLLHVSFFCYTIYTVMFTFNSL